MYVVDVGWKGTIQNNIQKSLPKCKIKGYYLGLVHYDNIIDYDKKEAVLFENSLKRKTDNGYLYNSNRSIFEILLAADHGSTTTYEIVKNKVKPILNNQKKELELYKNVIFTIQEDILKSFNNLVNVLKYNYYDNKTVDKKMNYKFFELMFKPTKEEIETYNGFYHFENFGVMNYSYFNSKEKINFIIKLKNYIHFKNIIRNDDTWQYLKLYNKNMKLGIKILYLYKKIKFKKSKII